MSELALPTSVWSRAQQVADAIGQRVDVRLDAVELLTGRAALLGLDAPTHVSSGGASRLLECANGWCALTLSRADDFDAVPALLEQPHVADPWEALGTAAATRPVDEFVARARLLDLPAAALGEAAPSEPTIARQTASATREIGELLVADLSSMWAGPLCARVLAAAGATVVKAETAARPDGTRGGNREFFDWMNTGKLCYTGDFADLLRAADVVIEGSRPAALARRGLSAERIPARPGRVWVRISGYGPDHPERVAFGDDAAVAGGLVMDGPAFCGDAIADPLAGVEAAAAALDAVAEGGGLVIDVSMAAVAATYAALPGDDVTTCAPHVPVIPGHAHDVGADDTRVRELIEPRLAC